ncbi:N-acetyltransferase 9-like protein isoform X2 [Cephus cinctus]|uniref:N-acetyltransferase 9-like protein isoform X2 n=1 Tax=Cephus cinctus TaxID=211228 RepID=A0AAJ7FCI5_CEPCN|nr:N-acetyltransferase 9-like protein isoform X2 [Cephus cinctus]
MKISTRILGKNVILVPYKEHHVSKYHEWMKSKELQYLTSSEPLTLEEEYAMQKSWHDAEDKCTFIVLDKAAFEKDKNEIESMIGDTNLFFNDVKYPHTAEAEIMIAEPIARGRRMGWEAMILMLRYGIEELKVKQFCVKIAMDNERSINMFKKLGFIEEGVMFSRKLPWRKKFRMSG